MKKDAISPDLIPGIIMDHCHALLPNREKMEIEKIISKCIRKPKKAYRAKTRVILENFANSYMHYFALFTIWFEAHNLRETNLIKSSNLMQKHDEIFNLFRIGSLETALQLLVVTKEEINI